MKKSALVLLCVGAAITLVGATIGFATFNYKDVRANFKKEAFHTVDSHLKHDLNGITNIVINSSLGELSVVNRTDAVEELSFDCSGEYFSSGYFLHEPSLSIEKEGGTLNVRLYNPFSLGTFFNISLTSLISMPTSYVGNIQILQGSGDTIIDLDNKLDEVSVDLNSGHVDIKKLQGSRVDFNCNSGSFKATEVEASTLITRLTSGSMDLEVISNSIDSSVTSGNLELSIKNEAQLLKIDVTSGSALIRMVRPYDFRCRATISSGKITDELGFLGLETFRDDFYKEGGTKKNEINLHVSSGTMSFNKLIKKK